MTVIELIKRYQKIAERSEYINIKEVINDLWQIRRLQKLHKIPKDER